MGKPLGHDRCDPDVSNIRRPSKDAKTKTIGVPDIAFSSC
jgi:hypothetical protein